MFNKKEKPLPTLELVSLSAGETHEITSPSTVTCVSGEVFDRVKGTLNTLESSAYYSGNITAKVATLLVVVNVSAEMLINEVDVNAVFGDECRNTYKSLYELTGDEEHKNVDLWRSDQTEYEFGGTKYKFNFWFCGPRVDCLFHNTHNFIEIHTGIAGDGYMQKSLDGTEAGIVETVGILPGISHRPFNIVGEYGENGNPKYPLHRWLGGKTGNIWLVVEQY